MTPQADKIMVITLTDHRDYPRHFWEEILKKNSQKLIWYDLQKNYLPHGREKAQKKLLQTIKNEKPSLTFMFDSLYYDLDLPHILTQIKKISPQTQNVFFSGDDDLMFDANRYLGIYFDYILVAQIDYVSLFKKDGISGAEFTVQTKNNPFKEKLKKKYDVSFIGTPKTDRKEIVEYLHKNKINISLFGSHNWSNYPQLKKIYHGSLPSADYMKTINQTKINICLSRNMEGIPHMKGRYLEYVECGAFSLVEESPQLRMLFKENKEIVFFQNKEDLLKKIKYYLANENERETIAKSAYKRLKKNYNFETELSKFIQKIIKTPSPQKIPKFDDKIININEKIIKLPKAKILKYIKNASFISFTKGKIKKSPFKDFLQIYSLKKNPKEISCCDYYLNSASLGDYARFKYCPFGRNQPSKYKPLLNMNQIIISKNFFIKNFNTIKQSYQDNNPSFVKENNTAFVSLPLVSVRKLRKKTFKSPEFSKELSIINFLCFRNLYSLKKTPLKLSLYVLSLLKETLCGKHFFVTQFYNKYKDENIKRVINNAKN